MRKATRGHALSEAEQKTNHTISRLRVKVAHIFASMAQRDPSGVGASD